MYVCGDCAPWSRRYLQRSDVELRAARCQCFFFSSFSAPRSLLPTCVLLMLCGRSSSHALLCASLHRICAWHIFRWIVCAVFLFGQWHLRCSFFWVVLGVSVGVPACCSDVLGQTKEQADVRGGYLWWRCYGALHPVLCCAVLAEEGWSQVRGVPLCPRAFDLFVWLQTMVVAQKHSWNTYGFFHLFTCPSTCVSCTCNVLYTLG